MRMVGMKGSQSLFLVAAKIPRSRRLAYRSAFPAAPQTRDRISKLLLCARLRLLLLRSRKVLRRFPHSHRMRGRHVGGTLPQFFLLVLSRNLHTAGSEIFSQLGIRTWLCEAGWLDAFLAPASFLL